MGGQLLQWFVYSIVVSFFAAYIAGHALGPGADYLAVFRFTGATAFMCYTVAGWQASIWYKRAWSTTLKNTFDGLVYACLTAGAFGWLRRRLLPEMSVRGQRPGRVDFARGTDRARDSAFDVTTRRAAAGHRTYGYTRFYTWRYARE